MRVLFIGGSGVISSACSELAIARGFELTLLNRGNSERPIPPGARLIQTDIRQKGSVERALEGLTFDAVVDWIAYETPHIEADIQLFQGRTGQYIFISSASAYQKPPTILPITESTPLDNPFWAYSRAKIACEERLMKAFQGDKFPITIIRPSHTYDQTLLPVHGGYTTINRMRKGKKVVIHGDGASLWTLTHHKDFAIGLIGLIGNPHAIGQAFHITSDEWLTWDQIHSILANSANCEIHAVHVPSEIIAAYDAEWGASLLGDKAHCGIFDNAKIKRVVPEFNPSIPFTQGAKEIISWYDKDLSRQLIDSHFDSLMDQIIQAQERTFLQ